MKIRILFRFFRYLALVIFLIMAGCYLRNVRWKPIRPSRKATYKVYNLKTTGYCSCKSCCNWKRNWFGRPVIASGPRKGKRKEVGITANGTRAKSGTIAADTSVFPFGTIMYIPGYGYGRVEDRGGAVKGKHIDLFFHTHKKALQWGVQDHEVKVWAAR